MLFSKRLKSKEIKDNYRQKTRAEIQREKDKRERLLWEMAEEYCECDDDDFEY